MHPMLNIAIRAARNAGTVIVRSIQKIDHLDVTTKGRNDYATEVDIAAEKEIINTIHKAYPEHAILAEESGVSGDNDVVWIIDPLDGTTNFMRGFPHYSVSIAISIKGKITHGVVYDPIKDELFTASRGEGAKLNDRRLRVTQGRDLSSALVATGFPFKYPDYHPAYLKSFNAVFPQVADIRRPGSAALDLAYVAAGRFDGYWEPALQAWDVAAGILLVEEAGGVVTDFSGDDSPLSGNVVAGNLSIQAQLLEIVQPHLQDLFK